VKAVRAGLVLSLTRIPLRRSAFWIPSQFRSSYFSECVHIAFRLVSESDSISKSSVSFCLSASSMAASSARELDAILDSSFVNFIAMFRLLPSGYHTPMPAVAFSQPLFTAEPSVLIFAKPPPGSMSFLVLAGLLSLRNGSPSFDLCPGIFPKILIPPSRQCVDLVSGLKGHLFSPLNRGALLAGGLVVQVAAVHRSGARLGGQVGGG